MLYEIQFSTLINHSHQSNKEYYDKIVWNLLETHV